MESLPVHTICVSFSGEVGPVFSQGSRTIILRFAGCNMSCSYCDTPDTQKVGDDIKLMTVEAICESLASLKKTTGISNVLVTGGEPLLYEQGIIDIVEQLSDMKFQIETNGSIFPKMYHCFLLTDMSLRRRVGFVVDVKGHALVDISYLWRMEDWFKYAIRYSGRAYFKIPFGLPADEDMIVDSGRLTALLMCATSLAITAYEDTTPLERGLICIFVSPIFSATNQVNSQLTSLITQTVNSFQIPPFVNIGVNLQLHKILSMP